LQNQSFLFLNYRDYTEKRINPNYAIDIIGKYSIFIMPKAKINFFWV